MRLSRISSPIIDLILAVGLTVPLSASVVPNSGIADLPDLMNRSILVCKGEVTSAPAAIILPSVKDKPQLTATALVRPDRCFKGSPSSSAIPIWIDAYAATAITDSDSGFRVNKGAYRLFFLTPRGDAYDVVDSYFGALQISRQLGTTPEGADSMDLLELDLKAGLHDPDRNYMLVNVRMLGEMQHLRSTKDLRELAAGNPDLVVKAQVWQALLRVKDYSVLPDVAEFFYSQPVPSKELLLPRDELLEMNFELSEEISTIRDPATLPILEKFATTGKTSILRMAALQAIWAIGSPSSAKAFLKSLDDPDPNNGFAAMQALLSLNPNGSLRWVPTWKQFNEDPGYYAAKCREWWATEATGAGGNVGTVR